MGRFIYWLSTACVLAVVAHLSYVLFIPAMGFDAAVRDSLKGKPANSFVILDPAQQAKLLPYATPDDLVGICRYNVKAGPVLIAAQVPRSFWTFAVYTDRGRQVYALNDRQADTDAFTVELAPGRSLLSQLTSAGDDSDTTATGDIGWKVDVSDPQGIAVLWVPQADSFHRAEAAALVAKSFCAVKDKP